MKTDASLQNAFLFNPEMSITDSWPKIRRAKSRKAILGLAMETQVGIKQEFICGVIMLLCLLFALSAVIAQFAHA